MMRRRQKRRQASAKTNGMASPREAPRWCCRAAFATHPGMRPRQEDALFVDGLTVLPSSQNDTSLSDVTHPAAEMECGLPCVFAIADGMGGQSSGDLASEICVCRIAERFASLEPDTKLRVAVEDAQALVQEVSSELYGMSAADVRLKNMGTTLVVLLVCADGCAVLSIGDSRAYRFEDGDLHLITRDDTEGQRLLDMELVSESELDGISDRDRITRYVGMGRPGLIVRASEHIFALERQLFLLCSDGLSKLLSPREIELVAGGEGDLLGQVESLVMTAASRDGSDNTSAILVRIG